MAALDIVLVGTSEWASGANAAGTPAPLAYPAGVAENDVVYLVVHNKPATLEPPDQDGWSKVGTATGGGGTVGTNDQGPSRITLYRRVAPAGGLSGEVGFVISGNNVLSATVRAYRAVSPGAGLTWAAEVFGSFSRATASTAMGGTIASALDLAEKDRVAVVLGSANDAQTVSSGPTLAATGATFGTVTKSPNSNAATATGADLGTAAWDVPVSAGASTTGPTITATSGTSATGIGFGWRVRASDSTGGGAPVVDAGADASIQLGQTFTRTAVETGSAITSRAWTILSGPAGQGSTIGTAAALSWTPTSIGSYVLQFAASSPNGTGADTVTVTVTAAGSSAPGQVYNLTSWKLTLPTGPAPGDPTEIEQPELTTYSGDHFYLNSAGRMVLIAPVQGVTTSAASGATRCEFREMENGTEAAWSPFSPDGRRLTVTMRVDPTSITDRQEVIIGQIHGAGDSPIPLILAAEWESNGSPVTPRIRVFQNSPGVGNMLSGEITVSTDFTYRIEYVPHPTNPASGGTVEVSAAVGGPENLPATPQFSFPASAFTDQVGWYFKCGAYNKSQIANGGTGQAVVEISRIELIAPGALETRRFYFPNLPSLSPLISVASWVNDGTAAQTPHRLTETPGGAPDSFGRPETTTTTPWYVLLGRWVSDPVSVPGTVFGDWEATVALLASVPEADLEPLVVVFGTVGLTNERRGTAISTAPDYSLPTSLASRIFGGAGTGADMALQVGDRLVVDVGYVARNNVATSRTGTLHYGGTTAPDLVAGATDYSRPAWIELQVTPGLAFAPGTIAAGAGSMGVALSTAATGSKAAATAGTVGADLMAAGTGSKAAGGTSTVGLGLAVAGAGEATRSSTGDAGLALDATGTGSPTRTGTGTAALTLSAAGVGERAAAGSGSAAATLATVGTGERVGDGAAAVSADLSAHGTGAKAATGTGTAGLLLDASGTGRPTLAGVVRILLGATGSGTAERTSPGSAELTVGAGGTGRKTATGRGSVGLVLGATGTADPTVVGAGRGGVQLAASGTGIRSSSGHGAVTARLGAAGTGTSTRTGRGTVGLALGTAGAETTDAGRGSARLALAASGTGSSTRTGRGTARLVLAGNSAGAAARGGAGHVALTLDADRVDEHRTAAGSGSAAAALDAAGAGARAGRGAGRVSVDLSATSAAGAVARSGGGTVRLALAAPGTGTGDRAGTGTVGLLLTSRPRRRIPGRHIASGEQAGLFATGEPSRTRLEASA